MKAPQTKTLAVAIPALLAGLMSAGMVSAQQTQTPPAAKPEKIEVTGTNIKRVDAETTAVIQVITREEIIKSGASTVQDLLRELPSAQGGNANDFGAGTGFQRGNSTVSLRGLGSVATLVLLNGRRLAPSPYADPNIGQGAGFNLNSIPISAIERIEVLKDGASAIYGSEAIAGVINVILRKDYKGAEVSVSHWEKTDGGQFKVNQASGSFGFGDLAKDRYNVIISGEYLKREPVFVKDGGSGIRNQAYFDLASRNSPFASAASSPANLRRESVLGSGNFNTRLPVDPRCPVANQFTVVAGAANGVECRYNTFEFITVQTESERKAVMARGTFEINANMTAFAEAAFTTTETTFLGAPPSVDVTAANTWFAANGTRFRYSPVLPVGHPDNPNAFPVGLRYRFTDLGPTRNLVKNDSTRVVAGITGTTGAWDWESGFLYTESKRDEVRRGSFLFTALRSAIESGSYRFNGSTNSAAVLDSLLPNLQDKGESKVTSIDLKGSREIFALPGGPAAIAVGAEFRRETMDINSDPRTVAGEIFGLASSTVRGTRNVFSTFAELSAPLFKNFEGQLAARYDRYNDFGNAFTPKAGVKYKITDSLAARANYGRGFRAPSLFQISESNVQSFNSGIQDPLRCPVFTATNPDDCNRTISSLISANKDLQPEKSTSYTYGFVFSPNNEFQANLDVWYVRRYNFIDRFDSLTVIRNEFNPAFTGGSVQRDPNPATWLPGVANSGPILSTIRRFDNFGSTATKGVDLDVTGSYSLGGYGKLRYNANMTYTDKVDWQLGKGVPYVNGAGNFYVFEAPRIRGVASLTWAKGDWDVTGRVNYVGEWYYGDPVTTGGGGQDGKCYLAATSLTLAYLGACRVESWRTYDLGVSWGGIKNLRLSALLRNISDKVAPYDPNQTTLGYNPSFHNPYGRYLQVSASYKFK